MVINLIAEHPCGWLMRNELSTNLGLSMSVNTLIDLPRERGVEMEASKLNFVECKIAHKSPTKLRRGWFMSDQFVLYFVSRYRQPSPWWTPVHRESTLTSHQNGRNNRYNETMHRGRREGERGKERLLIPLVSFRDHIFHACWRA